MNRHLQTFAAVTLATAGTMMLGACDDGDPVVFDDEEEFAGTFVALNSSGVSGVTTVIVDEDDDEFLVFVDAEGLDASITHAQHIHADAVCPTMEDDANDDGFLDVVEGVPSYGGILVPLDDDLTSQGNGTFPMADAQGVIDYEEAGTFTAVDASVRGSDEDIFVELPSGEDFDTGARTVVLHGIDPNTTLPATVQSLAGLPATATLPVACATLLQID